MELIGKLSEQAETMKKELEVLLSPTQKELMNFPLWEAADGLGLEEEDARWEYAVQVSQRMTEIKKDESVTNEMLVSAFYFFSGPQYLPEVLVKRLAENA